MDEDIAFDDFINDDSDSSADEIDMVGGSPDKHRNSCLSNCSNLTCHCDVSVWIDIVGSTVLIITIYVPVFLVN